MPTAGQLPSLQSYTQFLLFFSNQETNLDLAEYHNQIISTLKNASRKLVNRFPWLGGQVTNTGHRYVNFDMRLIEGKLVVRYISSSRILKIDIFFC
jgi:hypothetical protein